MEMERVPDAGYKIVGLPVAGLQRSLSFKNFALPFKILSSIRKARVIIKDFKPDVVVGVGGYASAPVLWSAQRLGIPCLIQEQNSFAGLTNKILAKRANKICTAYDGMERFFPKDRIILTGNPIREGLKRPTEEQREEGYKFYGLDPNKRTLFVVGGSLGARTLNEAMKRWILERSNDSDIQILWQCGKYYKNDVDQFLSEHTCSNVVNLAFIQRMDLAYAVADVIISRAGAGTISELCVCSKATIFVPSPHVAEDHQRHNALALVNKDAALMVLDSDAPQELMSCAERLLANPQKIEQLEQNISLLAKHNAAKIIANEVIKLTK
jgi:UDP-N-acetylglucosamine--N-acetylmuramyl-(pentapeptide) pyrophosphoryl-undecaprenol N-acetylglucosamine transferase